MSCLWSNSSIAERSTRCKSWKWRFEQDAVSPAILPARCQENVRPCSNSKRKRFGRQLKPWKVSLISWEKIPTSCQCEDLWSDKHSEAKKMCSLVCSKLIVAVIFGKPLHGFCCGFKPFVALQALRGVSSMFVSSRAPTLAGYFSSDTPGQLEQLRVLCVKKQTNPGNCICWSLCGCLSWSHFGCLSSSHSGCFSSSLCGCFSSALVAAFLLAPLVAANLEALAAIHKQAYLATLFESPCVCARPSGCISSSSLGLLSCKVLLCPLDLSLFFVFSNSRGFFPWKYFCR